MVSALKHAPAAPSGPEAELSALKQRVSENEAISTNLRRLELSLIQAETLQELTGVFTRGTARTFGLDHTTLALIDPSGKWRRHFDFAGSHNRSGNAREPDQRLLFALQPNELSPVYKDLHRPYVGPYNPSLHRRLFPTQPTPRSIPRSVALLPLRRQDRLLGALNCGSLDAQRFTREHATDFLHHFSQLSAVFLENALAKEELRQSTYTDGLTGCSNRRSLETRLHEEIARALRYRNSLCLLLFDIDYFKTVNDTYGHQIGDQVLVEFAGRLRKQLRLTDVVARYGGEEFAALLPQTDIRDALNLAERIRNKARETMLLDGTAVTVSVSIGVSEFVPRAPSDKLGDIGKRLLKAADDALYRAKAGGRNRVEHGDAISSELG